MRPTKQGVEGMVPTNWPSTRRGPATPRLGSASILETSFVRNVGRTTVSLFRRNTYRGLKTAIAKPIPTLLPAAKPRFISFRIRTNLELRGESDELRRPAVRAAASETTWMLFPRRARVSEVSEEVDEFRNFRTSCSMT